MAKKKKQSVPVSPSDAAKRMAARIPDGACGLPILVVLDIFTKILPIIIGGCMQEETNDPEEVQARVTALHESNPEKLRKRTAVGMRKEAKKDGKKISMDDAYVLADAAIAETIDTDKNEVSAFCANYM